MHILHTTPHTDGFCMPAEFDRHAGCLLIWPTREIPGEAAAGRHEKPLRQLPQPLPVPKKSPCWWLRNSTKPHGQCCRRKSALWKWKPTTPGQEMSAPLSSAMPRAPSAASTGASTRGAVWWTGCIFRGTRTTMRQEKSATCTVLTATTAVISFWKAAAFTATARERSSPQKAAFAVPAEIRT